MSHIDEPEDYPRSRLSIICYPCDPPPTEQDPVPPTFDPDEAMEELELEVESPISPVERNDGVHKVAEADEKQPDQKRYRVQAVEGGDLMIPIKLLVLTDEECTNSSDSGDSTLIGSSEGDANTIVSGRDNEVKASVVDEAKEKEKDDYSTKILDFGYGIRFRVHGFETSVIGQHYRHLMTSTTPIPSPKDETSSDPIPVSVPRNTLLRRLLVALVFDHCYLDLRSFLSSDGYRLIYETQLRSAEPCEKAKKGEESEEEKAEKGMEACKGIIPRGKIYGLIRLFVHHPRIIAVRDMTITRVKWRSSAVRLLQASQAGINSRLGTSDLSWIKTEEDVGIGLGCVAIGAYANEFCGNSRFVDVKRWVFGDGAEEVIKVEGYVADWEGVRRHLRLVGNT